MEPVSHHALCLPPPRSRPTALCHYRPGAPTAGGAWCATARLPFEPFCALCDEAIVHRAMSPPSRPVSSRLSGRWRSQQRRHASAHIFDSEHRSAPTRNKPSTPERALAGGVVRCRPWCGRSAARKCSSLRALALCRAGCRGSFARASSVRSAHCCVHTALPGAGRPRCARRLESAHPSTLVGVDGRKGRHGLKAKSCRVSSAECRPCRLSPSSLRDLWPPALWPRCAPLSRPGSCTHCGLRAAAPRAHRQVLFERAFLACIAILPGLPT